MALSMSMLKAATKGLRTTKGARKAPQSTLVQTDQPMATPYGPATATKPQGPTTMQAVGVVPNASAPASAPVVGTQPTPAQVAIASSAMDSATARNALGILGNEQTRRRRTLGMGFLSSILNRRFGF